MRGLPLELWAPPVFQPSGNALKHLAELETILTLKGKLVTDDFTKFWRDIAVQGALLGRQGFACVYCGRDLLQPTCGDVEHFRPKAKVTGAKRHPGYWWLAYSMENLFLSCKLCNSYFKNNYFPLSDENTRVDYSTKSALTLEARLLLDPMNDPVEDLVMTERSDRRVRIIPAPGISAWRGKQVEITSELLHFNKRHDLLKGWLHKMREVLMAIKSGDEASAKRAACRVTPFSIVARDVLRDERPEWLPSPSDEMNAFFQGLSEALSQAYELQETRVRGSEAYDLMHRSLWALAMLLQSQWHGGNAELEQWVDELGMLDEVNQRRLQLRVV